MIGTIDTPRMVDLGCIVVFASCNVSLSLLARAKVAYRQFLQALARSRLEAPSISLERELEEGENAVARGSLQPFNWAVGLSPNVDTLAPDGSCCLHDLSKRVETL